MCGERFYQGRHILFVEIVKKKGFRIYKGRWGECYLDQLTKLYALRDAVLVEGCRLGASPLEMGRLLTECEHALYEFPSWLKSLSQGKGVARGELENKLVATQKTLTLLYDLLALRESCQNQTPGTASEHRLTVAEANRKAMELALHDPALFRKLTARALAKRIGCSLGLVRKLPFWQKMMQVTGRGRQGRAARPKAVTFTDKLENTIGDRDEELQRLTEEQKADDRQQRIRSHERI